jgi:hypothetical protein
MQKLTFITAVIIPFLAIGCSQSPRYSIAASDRGLAYLVDSTTGETWLLAGKAHPVYLGEPVRMSEEDRLELDEQSAEIVAEFEADLQQRMETKGLAPKKK